MLTDKKVEVYGHPSDETLVRCLAARNWKIEHVRTVHILMIFPCRPERKEDDCSNVVLQAKRARGKKLHRAFWPSFGSESPHHSRQQEVAVTSLSPPAFLLMMIFLQNTHRRWCCWNRTKGSCCLCWILQSLSPTTCLQPGSRAA